MRALVVLLVACGGKTAPPEATSIENKAAPSTAPEPVSNECRPRGVVIDASIGEQAIGATLVFSGSASEQVAIADEKGQFSIEVDASHTRLTAYYNDRAFEWPFIPSYCHARIRLTLDPPNTPQTPVIVY